MSMWLPVFQLPAVRSRDDQGVADTGAPQAAAQLMEQTVGQRLQRQHHQQGAEEKTVGRLRRNKESQSVSLTALQLAQLLSDSLNWC